MKKICIVALVLSVLSAQAVKNKDWYVSDDMQYGRGIVPDANCTSDLAYAVTNCTSGYTVWVDDGFVWDKGEVFSNHTTNRFRCGGITLRSKSGYVDESDPKDIKGAIIRGELDKNSEHGYGPASVRGIETTSSDAKIIGFIFENCSAPNTSYPGGAVRGSGMVSNCVARNCASIRGGGFSCSKVYHCVVTNNYGGHGSGVYSTADLRDSLIAYNSGSAGVGYYDGAGIVSNCVIHSNSGGGAYAGGNSPNVNICCCIITNNSGSGVSGNSTKAGIVRINAFDCLIADNTTASQTQGGGALYAKLYRCKLVRNASTIALGGGASSSILTDCVVENNRTISTSGGKSYGGCGCNESTLTNCIVRGNGPRGNVPSNMSGEGGGLLDCRAVNCTIDNNVAAWRGGGAHSTVLVNCIVTNNSTAGTDNAGGGSAYNVEAYNTLFACNTAESGTGGIGSYSNEANENSLYNCTIANNTGVAFSGMKSVINCITWGNGTGNSSCTACTNSCVEKLSCSAQEGCFSTDPRLDSRYAPKSAKCHNKALPFDWMTDPNDVRSKDVYGAARVQGKGPDIGAVEQPDYGLMMLFR